MSRLEWDDLEERVITYGIDRGVIYPRIGTPVVWNGLVSLSEVPDEADHEIAYFDGVPYIQRRSPEGYAATVDAFTYPDELDMEGEVDLSYRVSSNQGDVIHLVYNARLVESGIDFASLNAEVDTSTFTWNLTTTPEQIDQIRATAHVIINGGDAYFEVMQILEDLIYGTDETPPRIPHLPELIDIFDQHAVFVIVDHGDGTWTATGPADMIAMLDPTTFRITSPSAVYLDPSTYTLSNW